MRNLAVSSRRRATLASDLDDYYILETVTNPQSGLTYVVTEIRTSKDKRHTTFEIFIAPSHEAYRDFVSVSRLVLPNPQAASQRLISATVVSEIDALCLVTASGDIVTIDLSDTTGSAEPQIVGSVDSGFKAATWGPDQAFLILVTGNDDLIQMTPTFDVLHEAPLITSNFGEDAPIDVGWGSVKTQFHGSLGKNAAQQAASSSQDVPTVTKDDDLQPRISWRGDGAFFAISSVESGKRVIRVYSPSPSPLALQSTSETTLGLEHPLAWNSTGSLIASSQRFGPSLAHGKEGRHDIIFFERNGLRRGGFTLVSSADSKTDRGYQIREVAWSCDSSVLSVWIQFKDGKDVVQLWTIGNYHWYLKHQIEEPSGERFTSVRWHPEEPLRIQLATAKSTEDITFAYETSVSLLPPPKDTGTVGVIDGSMILLTPFRVQNVPPPMSSYQISLTTIPDILQPPPAHISFSPNSDALGTVSISNEIQLWNLKTRLGGPQGTGKERAKVADPELVWNGRAENIVNAMARQIVVWSGNELLWNLAILGRGNDVENDIIEIIQVEGATVSRRAEISLGSSGTGKMIALSGLEAGIAWESNDGRIFSVDVNTATVPLEPTTQFPEFCFTVAHVPNLTPTTFIGLNSFSKLYVSGLSQALPHPVTSFIVSPSFLIYTTASHESHFIPISSLLTKTDSEAIQNRRVERGSRIVTVVPSTMSLVLQMPRGNLETINPRPLVLNIVRYHINNEDYREAFLVCRKRQIDLSLLAEHNFVSFINNIPKFVKEVHEVDYLNLFLTRVGRSSLPPSDIAAVCDSIRTELESQDLHKYVNSILTAHVSKSPPDLEAGLALLLRLRGEEEFPMESLFIKPLTIIHLESDQEIVEDAIKYIIYLVDADRLFDCALGMYDFNLVLMIAQHSQKDPREYLPFLRGLREFEGPYQRFKIDDYLKRREKALRSLRDAGPDKFSEAVTYLETHRLYTEALKIWRGSAPEEYERLLEVYGDYLFERREFQHAALTFTLARKTRKSMLAFEKAHAWREVLEVATRENIVGHELQDLAQRAVGDLYSRKRYSEAARVMLDYLDDADGAVGALVQGNEISEALRIISMRRKDELKVEVVVPAAQALREEIREEVSEVREQLSKQAGRLRELEERRLAEPDAFYMTDESLHNVDVMTDAGDTVATAFTRYTAAPSSGSSWKSKRTQRSKKKQERKKGRKGTVDEEEYILESVVKLAGRLDSLRTECKKLLPHLVTLPMPDDEKTESLALQEELLSFESELSDVVEKTWKEDDEVLEEQDARQILEDERRLKMPKKPSIAKGDWVVTLLDLFRV